MKTPKKANKTRRTLLRAGDAARLLAVSPGTIHRWSSELSIITPAERTEGGQALFRRSDILAIVKALDGKRVNQRNVAEAVASLNGATNSVGAVAMNVVDVTVRVPLIIDGDSITVGERPTVHAMKGAQSRAALEVARAAIDEVLEVVEVKEVTR